MGWFYKIILHRFEGALHDDDEMRKWGNEISIYVNFSRPWKSCAYCKVKVHLTTLTSQYYMDKAHAEWKPPLAETGNEKWQIFAKRKKKVGIHLVLHEGSDPRHWGSAFPCCTTEATLQGTRWYSVSMVSDVVHQKTRNPEVWSLTAEEKLKLHRCP